MVRATENTEDTENTEKELDSYLCILRVLCGSPLLTQVYRSSRRTHPPTRRWRCGRFRFSSFARGQVRFGGGFGFDLGHHDGGVADFLAEVVGGFADGGVVGRVAENTIAQRAVRIDGRLDRGGELLLVGLDGFLDRVALCVGEIELGFEGHGATHVRHDQSAKGTLSEATSGTGLVRGDCAETGGEERGSEKGRD